MSKPTFLNQLAQEVLKSNSNTLSELTIVLPNKRAKVFLLEELKLLVLNNVFAPEIISIEEFIQEISGIRSVDSVELLFEFYEVYLSITDKDKQESFENFAVQFYQNFHNQPQLLELMIDILFRVALADGAMHTAEELLIQSFHLSTSRR